MKKQVKATFTLTDKEIKEALYDTYVRKLKGAGINAIFTSDKIEIDTDLDYLSVSLTIIEERDYD